MLRNKNDEELIKKLADEGDRIGYKCFGPVTSILNQEHPAKNFARALYGCPSVFFNDTIDKIRKENPILEEPKVNKAFRNLTEQSGLGGSCRFWNKHNEIGDPECINSAEKIQKAMDECYEALANTRLK